MPSTDKPPTDPRLRTFLVMNGLAGVLMAAALVVVWQRWATTMVAAGLTLVAVVVAIGLAVGSYPFYRAAMRDELAQRSAARRSKPRI